MPDKYTAREPITHWITDDIGMTHKQWLAFVRRMGGPTENHPECLEWTGRVDKDGYGLVDIGRRTFRAHRLVLISVSGEDRPDEEACHTCDWERCVNADHLYWGTRSDNMKDRRDAGRQAGGRANTSYDQKMRKMFDGG